MTQILTTERQQFAEQNEMSLEFVNWFFDEKKESFGNMWFLMAAALWEGWKGRANREAQPSITDEAIDRIVLPLSPDGLDEEKYHCEWHLYHDRERIRKELREYFAAPPAPANANAVAWEMRYWNSGHNMWGKWERITAEQHAKMSVQHATDNDYEFRVLYDATPAPASEPIFFIEVEGDDWINAGRIPGSTFDFNNLPDGVN
ncbi:hypothetical protein [Serratia marcescens]|uniref:hypothetical protein n=1 Tax=Serratia marcescens TaxID=615 RepID=UPI001867BD03|nr:hypothetical protein [Serratia marcescens]